MGRLNSGGYQITNMNRTVLASLGENYILRLGQLGNYTRYQGPNLNLRNII